MLLYEDHQAEERHKGIVYAIAFSPDGSAMVSAGKDGALYLRDSFGQRIPIIEPEENSLPVHSVVFASDGSLLVGGAFGLQGYRQEAIGSWQVFKIPKHTPTNAVALLDENTLALGTGERDKPTNGVFELWDLNSARRREPRFKEPNGVWAVATCPARRMVAWATGHKKVRVWEVIKQKTIDYPQPKPCHAMAIHPEGKQFAAAVDYGVKVFNHEKQVERFELRHGGRVECVVYSPDGSTIATGSWDKTVKLWDSASGQERATFKWPIGRVYCLAYAPDGLRLAAGGDEGSVVVWDMD